MDNRVKIYDPQKSSHHSPPIKNNAAPASYCLQTVATKWDLGSASPPLYYMYSFLVLRLPTGPDIGCIGLVEYEGSSYLKYAQYFPFSCSECLVVNPPLPHCHHPYCPHGIYISHKH